MKGLENLKSWKPGQSGNPGGRTRLPDDLKAIKALTTSEVCRYVSKYARMSREELQKALNTASTPMLELTIASIFANAVKHGDFARLAFLLDRAIGKVPVAIEDDEDRAARKEIEDLSDAELVRIVAEKLPEMAKKLA